MQKGLGRLGYQLASSGSLPGARQLTDGALLSPVRSGKGTQASAPTLGPPPVGRGQGEAHSLDQFPLPEREPDWEGVWLVSQGLKSHHHDSLLGSGPAEDTGSSSAETECASSGHHVLLRGSWHPSLGRGIPSLHTFQNSHSQMPASSRAP